MLYTYKSISCRGKICKIAKGSIVEIDAALDATDLNYVKNIHITVIGNIKIINRVDRKAEKIK